MSDKTETDKRIELLRQIEAERNSKAILYVTGDRPRLETQISHDVLSIFSNLLDSIGPVPKISLVFYTVGGNISAAWTLVNLLHMYCEDFEVIVPGKCLSAGTLMALGANRIIMTKQATMGPIDPTIHHELGPPIPGPANRSASAGVSVEAVRGYLDAIRSSSGGEVVEVQAILDLSKQVHPLVLGQIFRSRQQIRDLARKLLARNDIDDQTVNSIIDFLCSDSGSHDYTINRREAEGLGLRVEKCSWSLFDLLQKTSNSFSTQLKLTTPFNVYNVSDGKYIYTRSLVESVDHGAHHYVSEGSILITKDVKSPQSQKVVNEQRDFEGWRKVK